MIKGNILLAAVFFAAGVFAQEVDKVIFKQNGSSRLSEVQLSSQVKLRRGIEYTRAVLDADIKRLHGTGNFSDVTGEAVSSSDGKVNIIFTVTLRPRIGKIELSGNAKFPTHELSRLLTISEGAMLNDIALRESIGKLRQFYIERGYRDVVIPPPAITAGADGNVTVTIRIEEHLRLKINTVSFAGAAVFSQSALRSSIATGPSIFNYFSFINDYLNYGVLDRAELELDKARLRDKYHNAGYLDFKITGVELLPLKDDPEYINVTFHVVEGKPYKVGAVSVAGAAYFKNNEPEKRLLLKTGDIFSKEKEEASARNISALYDAAGFSDIICRPVRSEDFEKKTVDLRFEIAEGRKYRVRDVIIVGNTHTKDKVIRRELLIKPVDPVDRQKIEISRQRLLGMGYFSKVEAAPVNADALNEKDVRISVQEKESRYHFRIGAGASDVNSFFGFAELSADNVDILDPSNGFYGGGQRVRIRGMYGDEHSGFNVDFVEPWLMDKPIRFELSGFMNLAEYDNWDEWHTGVRTSVTRKIFDDFTSFSAGYKFEVVRVTHIDHRLKAYFRARDLDGTFLVSQPFFSISRDTRDSLFDPTEGYNLNLFASVSPMVLGTSSNYYRLEAKGSWYTSFFDRAIIVMAGVKAGTVSDFNTNEGVPVFERYLLGGGDSLRGFKYRSVGPIVNRRNVGGQTMLLATAEITHPIWGPVRGAVFADIGNAWQDSWDMDFSDINIGAGYGLRIKIPQLNVPIKLDLAYPVLNNQKCASDKLRIHFNVGFSF
jgi:outer membrane protein insertion porin family